MQNNIIDKDNKKYDNFVIMINVLYIHGMGGGGDSRIPSILNQILAAEGIEIIVKTYDFDPEVAAQQIA